MSETQLEWHEIEELKKALWARMRALGAQANVADVMGLQITAQSTRERIEGLRQLIEKLERIKRGK